MKSNHINQKAVNTLLILFSVLFTTTLFSQFKVRQDEAIQIGYENYRYLSFGKETNSPNNGKYAIDYWGDEVYGLNFWKPWPTPNYTNYILFLRDDHNIGMGTVGDANYRLDVAGKIRCTFISTSSDLRFKENIKTIESPLETLMKLRGVSYNLNINLNKYSDKEADYTETKRNSIDTNEKIEYKAPSIGFIAQEVQEVLPQLISEDEKGYLSMDYQAVIPLLVEAIKEQQETITKLEDKVSSIESNCCSASYNSTENSSNASVSKFSSYLENNSPNPFSSKTEIQYYLSKHDKVETAKISIYNLNGYLVSSFNLSNTEGKGSVVLEDKQLKSGSYVYNLSINNKVIDSKIMIKVTN